LDSEKEKENNQAKLDATKKLQSANKQKEIEM